MRVIVTVIDIGKKTRIEGDSWLFDTFSQVLPHGSVKPPRWDTLEKRDIDFWLDNWRYAEVGSPNHKSRVFCPWSSVLMVETREAKQRSEGER